MEKMERLEELVVSFIADIVSEEKSYFAENDYTLDTDIERVSTKSYYESEAYILLKHKGSVVELYPVQIVFSVTGEDPVLFVNEDSMANLEDDIKAEIKDWQDRYLAKA